jgi:hypothetical protein
LAGVLDVGRTPFGQSSAGAVALLRTRRVSSGVSAVAVSQRSERGRRGRRRPDPDGQGRPCTRNAPVRRFCTKGVPGGNGARVGKALESAHPRQPFLESTVVKILFELRWIVFSRASRPNRGPPATSYAARRRPPPRAGHQLDAPVAAGCTDVMCTPRTSRSSAGKETTSKIGLLG